MAKQAGVKNSYSGKLVVVAPASVKCAVVRRIGKPPDKETLSDGVATLVYESKQAARLCAAVKRLATRSRGRPTAETSLNGVTATVVGNELLEAEGLCRAYRPRGKENAPRVQRVKVAC